MVTSTVCLRDGNALDHSGAGAAGPRDESHGFWVRLAAAYWGSFIFHFALLMDSTVTFFPYPEVLAFVGLLFIGYSAVFALVVAVGVPNGTVVLHFCYGAILPAFAYGLGGLLEVGSLFTEG